MKIKPAAIISKAPPPRTTLAAANSKPSAEVGIPVPMSSSPKWLFTHLLPFVTSFMSCRPMLPE